jgi:hypothetical protein
MSATEFVAKLAEANPSVEDWTSIGLTPREANSFRRQMMCEEREAPLGLTESNDLFALMNRWSVGHVEVGMVRFAKAPVQRRHGVQVGVVESDPLLLHPDDELVVHERGALDHTLWPVAKSPNAFLKALVVAARFLSDRGVEKIDFDDFQAAQAAARECAQLAGGDRYYDFYCMLLGAEE